MKTLRRFWEWHDAERPSSETRNEMLRRNLDGAAEEAIGDAYRRIARRLGHGILTASKEELEQVWGDHAEALRDLSLALCEALERMHEQVPEGKRDSDGWRHQLTGYVIDSVKVTEGKRVLPGARQVTFACSRGPDR